MSASGSRQSAGLGGLVAGALVAFAFLVTACGGSSKPTASGSSLAPTTSSPASPIIPKDPHAKDKAEITAVLKAWSRLNRVLAVAGNDGNDLRIGEHLTGPQLEHIQRSMQLQVAQGHRVRIPVKTQSRYQVLDIKVDGDVAAARTCEVDDAIVESSEGVVLNDRVMTFTDKVEVRRVDEGWRIWTGEREASFEGAQPCNA